MCDTRLWSKGYLWFNLKYTPQCSTFSNNRTTDRSLPAGFKKMADLRDRGLSFDDVILDYKIDSISIPKSVAAEKNGKVHTVRFN